MVIRGHGLLNALSVHHNERDAIRKGPLFVRALVVKFRTLGEQVVAGRYDPESIVSLNLLDERDSRGSGPGCERRPGASPWQSQQTS